MSGPSEAVRDRLPSDRFAGKTCATCGGQATVADGIAGVYLCDGNECMTAAYDKAWPVKATEADG